MRGFLVFAVALSLAGAPALAANPRAQALIKEGDRLYKENKYLEAAAALKDAYALEPNPTLLYNIARALDQAGELQQALDQYRTFVGLEGADPALVKKANLAMDRLRTLVARAEADQRLQEAERKRLEGDAQKERSRAQSEAEKAKLQREQFEAEKRAAEESANKKSSGRKIAAFAVGGAAIVGLGVGIGFGVAANSSKSAFTRAETVADKQRLESETRTRALVADVSLGLSLAAAIAAVVVYPGSSSGPQVSVVPISGGAFATVGGSF